MHAAEAAFLFVKGGFLGGRGVSRRCRATPRPPIVRSRPTCSTAETDAGEAEVKKFYQFLADWEKQHLEALRTLYNSVRTDFFAAGSFSPF